jgi:hypothetical protein
VRQPAAEESVFKSGSTGLIQRVLPTAIVPYLRSYYAKLLESLLHARFANGVRIGLRKSESGSSASDHRRQKHARPQLQAQIGRLQQV